MNEFQDTKNRLCDFLMRHAEFLVLSCAIIFLFFMMYQTYMTIERMLTVFKI